MMLQSLFSKWFGLFYYVRFDGKRLRVSTPDEGVVFDETPLIAIETTANGKAKVAAVGNSAKSVIPAAGSTIKVLNAYAHPRIGVGDFTCAEAILKHIFRRLGKGRLFKLSPTVIMHPLYRYEDEFTQVELRVFRELAIGAGAKGVFICTGHELTDDELRSFKEPVL